MDLGLTCGLACSMFDCQKTRPLLAALSAIGLLPIVVCMMATRSVLTAEIAHADAEVYQQSIELNQGYLEAMTGQRDTSKVCIRPSQCSDIHSIWLMSFPFCRWVLPIGASMTHAGTHTSSQPNFYMLIFQHPEPGPTILCFLCCSSYA